MSEGVRSFFNWYEFEGIKVNRADAIDLDIQSKKKECTNCLGRNLDQLEYEAHMKKGAFLLNVMHTAYQCNESKVVSEASKKLLDTIKEL